jgi:hypothetical protein
VMTRVQRESLSTLILLLEAHKYMGVNDSCTMMHSTGRNFKSPFDHGVTHQLNQVFINQCAQTRKQYSNKELFVLKVAGCNLLWVFVGKLSVCVCVCVCVCVPSPLINTGFLATP